jgi:hypothetical protein
MMILPAMLACGQGDEMVEQNSALHADLILVGGTVLTGDGSGPPAEAVAIADGRIVAVGSRTEMEALATSSTRVDELAGGVVVPGLVDAHGHVLGLGFSLRRVNLREAPTFQDVVSRVQGQAARQGAGSWILGRGWDQSLWPGRQFPHHGELSTAVPDHPVLVTRVDGHAALANAAALARRRRSLARVLWDHRWHRRTGDCGDARRCCSRHAPSCCGVVASLATSKPPTTTPVARIGCGVSGVRSTNTMATGLKTMRSFDMGLGTSCSIQMPAR